MLELPTHRFDKNKYQLKHALFRRMHTYSTCCAAAGVFYDGRGLGSSV